MILPDPHRNPSIRSTLRSFVQPLERHDSPARPPEIRRASTGPSRRICASTERLSLALAAIQSRRRRFHPDPSSRAYCRMYHAWMGWSSARTIEAACAQYS
jgi:hypothetical protein